MSSHKENVRKITTRTLREMKQEGEKIACITAYDAAFARVIDRAGMDEELRIFRSSSSRASPA